MIHSQKNSKNEHITHNPSRTDAGNGSYGIGRVSDVLRSPSPDLRRWPIQMSEQPQPRNRYVLRTESGHPGYKNAVILGTAPDLLKLSDDIRELSNKGNGRVDHYVTEEKKPTSLRSVVFEVISERELGDLQRADLKDWFSRKFGCMLFFLVLSCAVYGGYTAISNLLGSMK